MSQWNQPPTGGAPPGVPPQDGSWGQPGGAPQGAAAQPGAMVPAGQPGWPQPAAAQAAMAPPPAAGGQPMQFKFSLQKAPKLGARQAVVAPEALVLDGMSIPYHHIDDTETRDQNLVIMVNNGHYLDPTLVTWLEEERALIMQVRGFTSKQVEAAIDRNASWHAAERVRQQLAAEGREAEFVALPCPKCGATIDLTGMSGSQYVYCRFCLSVFQPQSQQAESDDYRTCDECGMFDRVKGYTEFYFYFLLIVYGFSSTRRHMCDTCAGGLFWKTLLINFIFVLGVPSAIWIKIKSLQGRDPALSRLSDANRLARKGRAQEAKAIFAELHQRYPNHPGLLMNEAQGHLNANDGHSAMACLEAAMQSCDNYLPAFELMEQIAMAANALPQEAQYG